MDSENEDEVFSKAGRSIGHLNAIAEELDEKTFEDVGGYIKAIRHDLEIIKRRSDPARFPPGDDRRRVEEE